MNTAKFAGAIAVALALLWPSRSFAEPGSEKNKAPAPQTSPWAYSLTVDGNFTANQPAYLTPVFTADRGWLHLEGRYGWENLDTASVWAGYNYATGKKVVLAVTPMIGGVFGRTTGIAPGCEASLTYAKLEAWISNEYVYNPTYKSENFYYSWLQLDYSPSKWLTLGVLSQHTKAFGTPNDVQPGVLAGISERGWEFTTYVFAKKAGDPTAILETGYSF